ncbi:MAG: hypothetical protein C5B50_25795 [Verrucomicrobia bacterium]|nr:MAG: hypothetical protein C5B50_25795 [Verrucomicrobiota bacterium]
MRTRRRARETFRLALVSLLLPGACWAAIPDNDAFATRIPLYGTNVSTTSNNIGATKEAGEPDPNFTGGKSVWWTWTAPASGYVTISTAGSSFDTTLAIYTGSVLTNLNLVAFNNNELSTSEVDFNVTAGTTYQIQVDGDDTSNYPTNNAEGNIVLQLSLAPLQPPPSNDNFANRLTLTGSHLSNVTGSNVGASGEPGEPFHADTLGFKSVWWTWTAPASGGLTLTTKNSSFDTVLAVYTGNSVSNLTLVAANDEDPIVGLISTVNCNVISNVTYQIAVDGFEGASGNIRLVLNLGTAFPVPANDNFTNRIRLTGSIIATNWSNVGATYEPNEPMHLVTFGGKSVWWTWTAPSSGAVTLTASNAALDTLLAVYTGTALTNLIFVAGNEYDFFTNTNGLGSTAFFNATSGVNYQIVVDGADGNTGSFDLRLSMDVLDPIPPDDNFTNRIGLAGSNLSTAGTNIGATLEVGEPLHRGYYGGHSLWWKWTSPNAGIVTMSTTNNVTDVPDTLMAVYTGSSLTSLTEVASDNNSGGGNWASRVTFPTKSNVTYQVAVDGVDGDEWINLRLNIHFSAASYGLTNMISPAGAGSVGVAPLPDQGGKYAPGSVVTLTATPVNGYAFTNWTGSVASTNNPVTLLMNANKTLSANFLSVPPLLTAYEPQSYQSLRSNGFRLLLTGPTNFSYSLERSSNFTLWTAIQTSLVTSVPFEFRDSSATNAAFRFYRARRTP